MHSIVLIAAMSATTGLFGGGKHCGGKAMHHGRSAAGYSAAPMTTSACGGSPYGGMAPSTGMASMQGPGMPAMSGPGMTSGPAVPLASPSMTIPPAPNVPSAPVAPSVPAAPPAPPAPAE